MFRLPKQNAPPKTEDEEEEEEERPRMEGDRESSGFACSFVGVFVRQGPAVLTAKALPLFVDLHDPFCPSSHWTKTKH